MLGRRGVVKSAGLGRQQLVYEEHIPAFLQRAMRKSESAESEQAKEQLAKALEDRPEFDDEQPVIVAEEDLKNQWEGQQEQLKKQEEAEKDKEREELDEQRKHKLMEISKFQTNADTTHVFRVKDKSHQQQKLPIFGQTKRKQATSSKPELPQQQNKRLKVSDPTPAKKTMLSFSPDDNEEDG